MHASSTIFSFFFHYSLVVLTSISHIRSESRQKGKKKKFGKSLNNPRGNRRYCCCHHVAGSISSSVVNHYSHCHSTKLSNKFKKKKIIKISYKGQLVFALVASLKVTRTEQWLLWKQTDCYDSTSISGVVELLSWLTSPQF